MQLPGRLRRRGQAWGHLGGEVHDPLGLVVEQARGAKGVFRVQGFWVVASGARRGGHLGGEVHDPLGLVVEQARGAEGDDLGERRLEVVDRRGACAPQAQRSESHSAMTSRTVW